LWRKAEAIESARLPDPCEGADEPAAVSEARARPHAGPRGGLQVTAVHRACLGDTPRDIALRSAQSPPARHNVLFGQIIAQLAECDPVEPPCAWTIETGTHARLDRESRSIEQGDRRLPDEKTQMRAINAADIEDPDCRSRQERLDIAPDMPKISLVHVFR
jgi:hypothetical protein